MRFGEQLKEVLEYHNFVLTEYYKAPAVDYQQVLEDTLKAGEEIRPRRRRGRFTPPEPPGGDNILFEGAQGAPLDIDLGTYPFVTSSNTTAGGTAVGSGFGPLYLDYILGITKAYATRVGSGPFPTELFDDVGVRLAERGHEFGSTTGRARRCGWFDAVACAKRFGSTRFLACALRLDVLDGLRRSGSVGYQDQGGDATPAPSGAEGYDRIVPVYEDLPGWSESTVGARRLEDLPANARAYLKCIEETVGAPIDIISTGPDRAQTIVLRDPFDA